MGYGVIYEGRVTFRHEDEKLIVQAFKNANELHDKKSGQTFPHNGDPYHDYYFAFMPRRFHEDEELTKVSQIMEMMGFSVVEEFSSEGDPYVTLELNFHQRSGDEDVLLNSMAHLMDIDIYALGDDGARWRMFTSNGKLLISHGEIVYTNAYPIEMDFRTNSRTVFSTGLTPSS